LSSIEDDETAGLNQGVLRMSFRDKKKLILPNPHLPLEELSIRTGLRSLQVQKIMESSRSESLPAPLAEAAHPWPRAVALIPVLLTFLIYLPSLGNQFVNWDDLNAIQWNSHLRVFNAHNFHWMLTTFHLGNWIPLTWISLSLDYQLGKLDPRIYHLDNLVLHCLNTGAVFFLSARVLGLIEKKRQPKAEESQSFWVVPAASFTALLFGLHPLHVESVAWATERKDLLYGLFYLLGLILYLDYASAPILKSWKLHACLGLFVLAILSKPMAVTLPLVLILLDVWPLDRFRSQGMGIFWEKIPLFALALLSGVVASLAQSSAGSYTSLSLFPLDFRFMNAFHSLIFYMEKMIFPAGLAALYPLDLQKTFSPDYVMGLVGTLLITAICVIYQKKRPYLAAAWIYYGITLAPVLGIIQVGSQAAADRYTYLPSLAPFLLFGAVTAKLFSRQRFALILLAVFLAAALAYGTYEQTQTWRDSTSLWENVLRVNPRNSRIAHANLADGYLATGRFEDALREFDRGIAIGPPSAFSFDGKGRTLLELGRPEEALQQLKAAADLEPKNAEVRRHLGMAYKREGMLQEALEEIQEAVRLDPDNSEGHYDLGVIYISQGQTEKSVEAFQEALALDPDNPAVKLGLAEAMGKK
jgi:protein O-mannosyl-transferase